MNPQIDRYRRKINSLIRKMDRLSGTRAEDKGHTIVYSERQRHGGSAAAHVPAPSAESVLASGGSVRSSEEPTIVGDGSVHDAESTSEGAEGVDFRTENDVRLGDDPPTADASAVSEYPRAEPALNLRLRFLADKVAGRDLTGPDGDLLVRRGNPIGMEAAMKIYDVGLVEELVRDL
jgi:hypothetical protein